MVHDPFLLVPPAGGSVLTGIAVPLLGWRISVAESVNMILLALSRHMWFCCAEGAPAATDGRPGGK